MSRPGTAERIFADGGEPAARGEVEHRPARHLVGVVEQEAGQPRSARPGEGPEGRRLLGAVLALGQLPEADRRLRLVEHELGHVRDGGDAQVLTDDQWHFAVTPYVWIVGLEGDLGVRRLQSNVDLAPWEIVKHLQFGFMANALARKGPYGLGLDGIYAKLGGARAFAIRGDTGGLDLTQHMTILQPTGGYTIGDSPLERGYSRALAGARR